MLSGLVGWAVRCSHRAWWAYWKSRGDYNRPSMWLSANPTATTTFVSTHVNNKSLSAAASLCPPCPQILHCVSCETGILQISRSYAYAVVGTAHIGMQVHILSVCSLHLEQLEMHKRRELGKVMNTHCKLFPWSHLEKADNSINQSKKLTKYTQMYRRISKSKRSK